ncbi:hypothetical protein F4804DRAFT_200652 [Jackrogersella minutella]|nr:hypothetical protein F4804DRAFT_200652 [Jackrogersella minutella]
MADNPRRRRNRPDSKQMWDESDRHTRHEPNARDKKDDRGREREEGGFRERDRRYRSRSRSPRRDRRDNNRGRRDRDRGSDRNRPRDNDEAKPKWDEPRDKKRNDRTRDRDNAPAKGPNRDRSPRRSASPARSPAGKIDRTAHNNSPLPTRPRPSGGKSEPGSSLQFKVGGKHDDEANHKGKSIIGSKFHHARGSQDEEHEDRRRRAETPNSRNGAEAMDEDGDDDDVLVEDDGGLSAMQAMMGFGGFGTTKNTHIPGNNAGMVRKEKKTEYRQYMNRVGGFNRPLSPSR